MGQNSPFFGMAFWPPEPSALAHIIRFLLKFFIFNFFSFYYFFCGSKNSFFGVFFLKKRQKTAVLAKTVRVTCTPLKILKCGDRVVWDAV